MRIGTAASAVAVVAALAASACSGGSATEVMAAVPGRGPQGAVPQFVVECAFSHAAPDDPIVHPGHPGRSHLHHFFGNTTADASSTLSSLLDGDTTCDQQRDLASYWAPALLDAGQPVMPTLATAYYRPAPGTDPTALDAYPPGLKMIAGDRTATTPQPLSVVGWACGTGSGRTAEPVPCREGQPLRLEVIFPDCWDGEHVDSADHQSHTARSDGGDCPDSHPVPIPQLMLTIDYPITGEGHDLALASGGQLSGHADFFNAWDQDKLETEIESCLHRQVVCGVVSNRRG